MHMTRLVNDSGSPIISIFLVFRIANPTPENLFAAPVPVQWTSYSSSLMIDSTMAFPLAKRWTSCRAIISIFFREKQVIKLTKLAAESRVRQLMVATVNGDFRELGVAL